MTALILLLPGTPMLFQGQEFWASTPFLYFADHKPDLAQVVRKGRGEFVSQFPSVADEAMRRRVHAPEDPGTFESCRLDWAEFERHADAVALHRDLLRLRREDPVLSARERGALDGAVLAPEAFALRFFGQSNGDRLLLVNFGMDVVRASIPEPLLAPPDGRVWAVEWSSEAPIYGGGGTPSIETDKGWCVPGHAAVLLTAGA
jgi:maltooligosyltrehalose trehalohydrolase